MTADERRVPIEGLPPMRDRPRCQRCHKPLAFWTHDSRASQDGRARIVRRVFASWKGYPVRHLPEIPLFCTLTCALSFAILAHEAGWRIRR